MTITLELSPELQARLRTNIARRDSESIRHLLADIFAPKVEALFQQTHSAIDDDEFEIVADSLATEFAACVKSTTPPLSDYAVSRAGIYEEHP